MDDATQEGDLSGRERAGEDEKGEGFLMNIDVHRAPLHATSCQARSGHRHVVPMTALSKPEIDQGNRDQGPVTLRRAKFLPLYAGPPGKVYFTLPPGLGVSVILPPPMVSTVHGPLSVAEVSTTKSVE